MNQCLAEITRNGMSFRGVPLINYVQLGTQDKGIGHKHALLYEAHASFLESNLKAHAKARAAFELGISRYVNHCCATKQ